MRSAVTARLLQAVPALQGVFHSTAEINAGVAEGPYVLVVETGEDTSPAWSGFRQIIELWLYVSRNSPLELDVLSEQMIYALDKELLAAETGERFLCLYEGTTGADSLDEPRDAVKRGLRFALIVPQQMSSSVQISSDPWLDAVQDWTRRILGEAWRVYNGSWPLGYEAPAVMWRIADMEVSPQGRGVYELQKQFTAFIAGMDADQEHQAILTLVEGLGRSVKIPLRPEDKSYLTILEPKVNMNANGVTEGQLSVTFSRRITGSLDGGSLMQFIQHTRI
ncbi:hypothetical protein [Paenibacillus bouchesdurhonensis]|uniref:hypothetical protein n=1 Tax=Paenibacillus bouchesdurhonensis TaxID=1870990 RepID=UPI0019023DA5|nr:hypothetical protein [Paenibacillus bouchesdurhonensis]